MHIYLEGSLNGQWQRTGIHVAVNGQVNPEFLIKHIMPLRGTVDESHLQNGTTPTHQSCVVWSSQENDIRKPTSFSSIRYCVITNIIL